MRWLIAVDDGLGAVSRACGWVASVAFVLMMLNVFYDVVARYAFNEVSIGMQELEWHLYAVVFLMHSLRHEDGWSRASGRSLCRPQ